MGLDKIVAFPQLSHPYLVELLIILFFVVLTFLYKDSILREKNKELKKLQDELVLLNGSLESKIKQAIVDLEQSQKMAKMGSWVLDFADGNLRWSKQTYEIFGIDVTIHENLYELFLAKIHPHDKETLINVFRESLEGREEYSLEHRLLMEDGSIKYVKESCETLFSQEGEPIISYGTVQDISDAVLIRQELEKKDAHLFHQSRLAQMGEMLSIIAHQWRQPLNAISLAQISITVALQLQKYDLSDKKQREEFLEFLQLTMGKVGLYVQNLSEIIADFSDFYKPNKTSVVTTVDKCIRKGYSIISASLLAKNINIELDLNSYSHIKLHENEFMQVIINILNNAMENFIQNEVKNPQIHIKSYDTQDETLIEIRDNGGGIEESIMGKIFDPYFSTKLDKHGTGLGLYMAKMIIREYHEGSIEAKNSDEGAVFTIKFKKYDAIATK